MTDITLRQDQQLPIATQIRFKDMGDGTYALVHVALMQGITEGASYLSSRVDELFGGLVVASHFEADVHMSRRFKASYLIPHGSELANDATLDFLIKVGSKKLYGALKVSAGGDSDLLLYEAPTITDDGVAIARVCKNRETLKVSTTLAFSAPTVTAPGNLLFSWFVLGGTHAFSTGGAWSETPALFAPNTDYLIRVTNRSGAGIQGSISLGWSEYD